MSNPAHTRIKIRLNTEKNISLCKIRVALWLAHGLLIKIKWWHIGGKHPNLNCTARKKYSQKFIIPRHFRVVLAMFASKWLLSRSQEPRCELEVTWYKQIYVCTLVVNLYQIFPKLVNYARNSLYIKWYSDLKTRNWSPHYLHVK